MMDRGWRRCGTYYYKLDFEKSCCQSYTIRLEADKFQISGSQKKILKRFNKYLKGEIDIEGKAVKKEPSDKKEDQKDVETQDPSYTDYQKYFKEYCPLELKKNEKLAHKYTCTITRAVCCKEAFNVFAKYQKSIHDESYSYQGGYDSFLCSNPLFDPKETKEANKDFKSSYRNNLDSYRDRKDEGVFPEFLGGYHMEHRLDGELFAVGVLDFTP